VSNTRKDFGRLAGSSSLRSPEPVPVSAHSGDDPGRKAREAWNRILNMDGGHPQTIAAAMWASIYADTLLNALSERGGSR
jgi:hypothetical protein